MVLSGSLAFKKPERHEEALKLNRWKKVRRWAITRKCRDGRWLSSPEAMVTSPRWQLITTHHHLINREEYPLVGTTVSIYSVCENPAYLISFYIRYKNCIINYHNDELLALFVLVTLLMLFYIYYIKF